MFTFSIVLVFINFLFLVLGAVLLMYAEANHIQINGTSDELFPVLAIQHLGPLAGIVFLIGLISAAYPSADGALTSLTTAFSIDFMDLQKKEHLSEKSKTRIRQYVHFGFALLLLVVIVIFKSINDRAIVDKLFTVAGYTYGPLLGLYAFGLFTKLQVHDKAIPFIAVLSPLICWVLSENSKAWFNGYVFGFELLIINGMIMFSGLLAFSKWRKTI